MPKTLSQDGQTRSFALIITMLVLLLTFGLSLGFATIAPSTAFAEQIEVLAEETQDTPAIDAGASGTDAVNSMQNPSFLDSEGATEETLPEEYLLEAEPELVNTTEPSKEAIPTNEAIIAEPITTDSAEESALEASSHPEPAKVLPAAANPPTTATPAESPTTKTKSQTSTPAAQPTPQSSTPTIQVKSASTAAKKSIANATLSYDQKVIVATKSTPASNVKVVLEGKTLTAGTDYKISYVNNTKVGKNAKLTITGIGAYEGTLSKSYEIVGAPSFTTGASRMPVYSTSAWAFTNATWKSSNANLTLSGKTATAVKAGSSYILLYDLTGKQILKQKVTIYSLDGAYVLLSGVGSNKALDVSGASKNNSANLQIYAKNGTQAQTFTFVRNGNVYEIVNANSGKAIDIVGASNSNSANAQQYVRNKTNAQKWRIAVDSANHLTFINVGSGKALDVAGASNKNGANVQQYTSNGTIAQKWTLAAAPVTAKGATSMPIAATAAWTLTNRGTIKLISGTSISVSGKTVKALKAGAATIGIYDSLGKRVSSKKITVSALSGKYFINSAINSKYSLEIGLLSTDNGGNAQINQRYGQPSQAFTFTRNGDYYVIKNSHSGKVLDVKGASKANSANVQQYQSNGTNAQKWLIKVDASNKLTFVNVGSGKALDVTAGKAALGQNVQQYTSNNTKAQKWTLSTYKAEPFRPGDYLAAAAVALSGCYGAAGSKAPSSKDKTAANNTKPTGSGWTLYNKIHDLIGPNVYTKGMYSSTKYYTDCGGNVALAIGWSGIDDGFVRSCSAKEQEKYMKSSNKWDSIGTYAFKDVASGKVTLQPGDVISINGYSHVAIYTGTTASSMKYSGATKAYYEAQLSAKEWAHLVSYSKSATTFNVYRRNTTSFNYTGSKYYNTYKTEREKYLVAGK